MDVAAHIDALDREGLLLADAAALADLDAPVPTCPGWCVRDLVRHAGGVHRWAAWNVAHPSAEPVPREQEERLMGSWPDDDKLLLDWFREGHAALVQTLRAAPPDLACWSFLPAPSPLAFWARRQAHETAIHRADAQAVSGAISAVAAEFGADGLDELLLRFAVRRTRPVAETPRTVALHATDVQRGWLVRLGPEGIGADAEAGEAECTVRGAASDLYLLMWNRRGFDGLTVDGDTAVLDLWRTTMRVRWA